MRRSRRRPEVISKLRETIHTWGTVTFLYAARDMGHNNAAALKEFPGKNYENFFYPIHYFEKSGYFCTPQSFLVPLSGLGSACAEKGMSQSSLFSYPAGFADAGPFEINTEETAAVKTVKPFMFTVRAGIVVRAYRTYTCIAELCHYLSILDRRQGPDFL